MNFIIYILLTKDNKNIFIKNIFNKVVYVVHITYKASVV